MKNNTHKKSLCPSSRYAEDARLLGIRQDNGKVAILPDPLKIDSNFIQQLQEDVKPEQAFRFVNKCMELGCKQWSGKGCGIATRAVTLLNQVIPEKKLPLCSIRNDCRWYQQEGNEACMVCSYIITDITAPEIKKPGDFRKFAINIEAQGIPVSKNSDKWNGDRVIEFDDDEVNIRMSFKGPKGGSYSIAVTINEVEKTISGIFANNGLNHIPKDYQLSDFKLTLA
jgi:hypothetical protein